MKLYILDDDRIELALWSDIITRSKYKIDFQLFADCGSFKAAVFKNKPDACIIDYIMPYHPGTEVCGWLKDTCPDTKIYICSNLDGEEYKILAESCGASFMSKTMQFNERLEVVYNGCKS